MSLNPNFQQKHVTTAKEKATFKESINCYRNIQNVKKYKKG